MGKNPIIYRPKFMQQLCYYTITTTRTTTNITPSLWWYKKALALNRHRYAGRLTSLFPVGSQRSARHCACCTCRPPHAGLGGNIRCQQTSCTWWQSTSRWVADKQKKKRVRESCHYLLEPFISDERVDEKNIILCTHIYCIHIYAPVVRSKSSSVFFHQSFF